MSQDIKRAIAKAELAARSLPWFLRYRFAQEGRRLLWNWHLDYICEVMTAVYKRQERFVLFNVPFRSLKTETVEQTWQAWMILQDDSANSSVLSLGADATLAEESSEKTRDIVGSDWFRDLAGMLGKQIGLDPLHKKRNDWKTVGGCERKSMGVGGTVVGKGADHLCIAAGSLIATDRGDIPIQQVVAGDHVATPIGWRLVRGAFHTGRRRVIRIATDAHSLRLTPDHRCSTPSGWREAGSLRTGDVIHAMGIDARITQVDESGEAEVYDLQVEDAHCFYANSILCHNCWGDILKPEEANSDHIRTKKCNWLGETFRSRMNDQKTGTLTGIMQRLHEKDPTGYLLEQMKTPGADRYLHVKIETECPKPKVYSYGDFFYDRASGELLQPNRVGEVEVAALKVSLGVNYEGQCNQNPIKMQGNTLKLSWLNRVDGDMPKLSRVYQSWDVAVTEEDQQSGCYTVCNTWGRSTGNQFYLLDVYRAKIGSVSLVEAFLDQWERHKPYMVIGTKGVIEKSVMPFLTLRTQELGVNIRWELITERGGSKMERGIPFLDACRNGNVYIPRHARWVPDWELEMAAIPNGAYWDQWDAAAIFFQALNRIKAGDIIDETPADTDAADRNDIKADQLRKALGKGSIPNATARAMPSVDVVGLLQSGKRVAVTADDYVHRARGLMVEHRDACEANGQLPLYLMAKGEVERLDRRYRDALTAVTPKA